MEVVGRIFCFLAVLPSGFQGGVGRMSGRPPTLVVLGFPRSGKGESEMALNDELGERDCGDASRWSDLRIDRGLLYFIDGTRLEQKC